MIRERALKIVLVLVGQLTNYATKAKNLRQESTWKLNGLQCSMAVNARQSMA